MKTKTFDCVEMKRQGAAKVQAELEGMTREQRAEYWRRSSEEFRREQEQLRERSGAASAPTMPGQK
jgi:hypothetical protein